MVRHLCAFSVKKQKQNMLIQHVHGYRERFVNINLLSLIYNNKVEAHAYIVSCESLVFFVCMCVCVDNLNA